MPIYAFVCEFCGHAFDKLQKLSDPDPAVCSECGQASVRRQVTAPSFRLAGGGWYETDFKKEGDKKRNLVDAATKPEKPEKSATPAPAPPAPVAAPAAPTPTKKQTD